MIGYQMIRMSGLPIKHVMKIIVSFNHQPTHMSLGNGNNLISGTMQGMLTQGAVANTSTKGQGNATKGQAGQGQSTNAAIASMVAKQQTVLPAQQNAAAPMVLGQIGVFSSQANANLANNFVPQVSNFFFSQT